MVRMDECTHFLVPKKCDEWIIWRFKSGEVMGGQDEIEPSDVELIEEICSKCKHFKRKPQPGFEGD